MDRLKSAIADKILEVSSSGGFDIKEKLDKINRFREFTDACQALIDKYPAIEAELLRMIDKNDFDTKVASIRVDTIIRLSENNANLNVGDTKADHSQTSTSPYSNSYEESFEDIGYKEMSTSGAEQYIDFEEITDHTVDNPPVNSLNPYTESKNEEPTSLYREPIIANTTVKPQINQAKDNAKKGIQVIVIVSIIVVLIFAIVFVIQNLETVLWGLGILVILALTIWIILFNKKKNTEDEEEEE